jgi:hypothetical protein
MRTDDFQEVKTADRLNGTNAAPGKYRDCIHIGRVIILDG